MRIEQAADADAAASTLFEWQARSKRVSVAPDQRHPGLLCLKHKTPDRLGVPAYTPKPAQSNTPVPQIQQRKHSRILRVAFNHLRQAA